MSICASQYITTTMKPHQNILLGLLIVIQPVSGGVVRQVVDTLFKTFADADHSVAGGGGGVYGLYFLNRDTDHEVAYDFEEDFTDIRSVAMTMFVSEGDDCCGFDGSHTWRCIRMAIEEELEREEDEPATAV